MITLATLKNADNINILYKRPTLHVPENKLMLRVLPWGTTYVVTIQRHLTKASA